MMLMILTFSVGCLRKMSFQNDGTTRTFMKLLSHHPTETSHLVDKNCRPENSSLRVHLLHWAPFIHGRFPFQGKFAAVNWPYVVSDNFTW